MDAVAVIVLALSLAGCVGLLVWQASTLASDARRAATSMLLAERSIDSAARDRDIARAASARLGAELTTEAAAHRLTQELLSAAREEISDAQIKVVTGAAPADRGAAVDGLLAARVKIQRARARGATAGADRGDLGAAEVSRPGAATGAADGDGGDVRPDRADVDRPG